MISWLFSITTPQFASHSRLATFSMYVISTLISSFSSFQYSTRYLQLRQGNTTIMGVDFLQNLRLQLSPRQVLANAGASATPSTQSPNST